MNTPVSQVIGDLLKQNGEVDCPDCLNFKSGLYGKATSEYEHFMRNGITKNIPDSHRFAKHRENTNNSIWKDVKGMWWRGRKIKSGKKDKH